MRADWAHAPHFHEIWHCSVLTLVNAAVLRTLHFEGLHVVAALEISILHCLGVAPVDWPWMALWVVSAADFVEASGETVGTFEADSFLVKFLDSVGELHALLTTVHLTVHALHGFHVA